MVITADWLLKMTTIEKIRIQLKFEVRFSVLHFLKFLIWGIFKFVTL